MSKGFMRFVSMVLTLVMVFMLLPTSALAEYSQEQLSKVEQNLELEAEVETEESEIAVEAASIVGENLEKRDRYQKEFYLDNGTNLIVVYPEPVHYETEEGWEEIDNTLESVTYKGIDMLTNTAGDWTVNLPQSMSGNMPVMVSQDGYTLSFALENKSSGLSLTAVTETLNVSTAEIKDVSMMSVEQEQLTYPEATVETLNSRVEYAEVFDDVDLRYDLSSEMLKESIIINEEPTNQQSYTFNVAAMDLSLELQEDGSIWAMATDIESDEPEFVIAAPYMEDANGEHSYEVETTLTAVTTGEYKLTYTPSYSWLTAEERAYPVALDPTVSPEQKIANIDDIEISSRGGRFETSKMNVGYSYYNGKQRIFLKFNKLPTLTSSDVIVNAQVKLTRSATNTKEREMHVHALTGTWDEDTITWANKPIYDPIVEDYAIITGSGHYYWNVTDIARKWYEGENTGMMFKLTDEIEANDDKSSRPAADYNKEFDASNTNPDALFQPVLYLTYVNNRGLESYWDYHTQSAGRAGTGYVNDFTGNLVWTHSDMGYSGNLAPVSISHIYSANDKDNNAYGAGYGWRLNYNQSVYKSDAQYQTGVVSFVNYYVWEDSDGTQRYFTKKGSVSGGVEYTDELSEELTLKVVTSPNDSNKKYELRDKDGNTNYFDTNGRLTKIENNQETKSSLKIEYSGTSKKISQITDGAGRKYVLEYDGNGLLSMIKFYGSTDPDSEDAIVYNTMSYGYTNGDLTSITYYDEETVSYGYEGTTHLLTTATNLDGYNLTYTYSTAGGTYLPHRVIRVAEKDGTVAGGTLDIEYATCTTKFTDIKGNTEIYRFNDYGNTISIQNEEGQAVYAKYAKDEDSDGKANQLILSSKLQNTVKNYVYNSNAETNGYWGSNIGTVDYSTESYIGAKSIKITSQTAGECVKIYPENDWQLVTTGEAGETYTFSAYVKTEGMNGGDVKLKVENTNSSSSAVYSDPIVESSEWTRIEVSYTTSTLNETLKYSIELTGIGTAYVDCLQFENTPTASRYNLVQNGDFSIADSTNTGALNWYYNASIDTTEDQRVTQTDSAAPQLDNYVFKIEGEATGAKRVYQDIPISGQSGDVYTVTGWAMGDSAPLTSDEDEEDGKQFCLVAQIYYKDGTSSPNLIHFNPDIGSENNWQYASGRIVAEYDEDGNPKQCEKIRLCLSYRYNVNEAYFDGIQVFKEEFGHSYVYDDEGNVVSVTDLRSQTTEYEYENNDLTKAILPTGAEQTYTYDEDTHNVLTATSPSGLTSTFDYDTYGNNTEVSIEGTNQSITSTARYIPTDEEVDESSFGTAVDGNLLRAVTDSQGNTTRYVYQNEDTGFLTNVIAPTETAWTGTHYGYDSLGRLVMLMKMYPDPDNPVNELPIYITYSYEDDQLTSINRRLSTFRNSSYNFTYGDFGIPLTIKAGDNTLISHEYNTDDGSYTLKKSTYGNEDSIEYTYDNIGRTTSITYDGAATPDVEYQYDNNGNLGVMTDHLSNRETKYLYDHSDRLIRTETRSISDTPFSYMVESSYDDINNLTGVVETINGTDYITSYTYDEDNRVTGTSSGNSNSAVIYDEFSRIESIQRKHNDTNVVGYTYNYWTSGDKTSTQLNRLTINTGSSTYGNYSYDYDENGNIVMINGGRNTIIYHYDDLNQLVRVDDRTAQRTWTYTYDFGGNILKKSEYYYTLSDTLSESDLIDSIDYTYSSGNWGDLLESYDGQTIESDAIGNITDDGTWIYTWQHGRQLASMTNGSTTVSYGYDASGMRTSKTIGNTTWQYVYNGSTLSYMTDGDNDLFFSYDSNGPMSVSYNDTVYYYVQNAQGDIIALVNSSGAEVVTYSYDAWGKLLSVGGSMANTLGQHNPLRYRGYVYDTETGLYYLQSRYYNPELCRLICADIGISEVGGNILGYNMFAYCFNNPTNMDDQEGNWPKWIEKAAKAVKKAVTKVVEKVKNVVNKFKADVKNYDRDNESEEKVFSSNYFSSYKGKLVVKTPFDASFSFGFIGLSHLQETSNTLNHEYGHTIQFDNMGLIDYTNKVAIPSLTINILNRMDKLPYDYYGAPWEAEADKLGGVNRTYDNTPWPEVFYDLYEGSWYDIIKIFWD